jgi:hypothetical protein
MNKRLLAKLHRNLAEKAILTNPANAASINASKPILNATNDCLTSFADAEAKALAAGIDYKGYTENRDVVRTSLAHEIAIICGNAYVKFNKLGKHDLAEQLHINETDYLDGKVENALHYAQTGHDIMASHLTDLTDYITATDLSNLQTLINNLTTAEGQTLSLHQASPADTAAAEAAILKTDEDIHNLLIVIRPLQKTNLSLYNAIVLNSILPPVNIHHSYLTVTVRDAATNALFQGAVLTINTSDKKTATTDDTGIGKIDRLRSGPTILTITAPGKPVKRIHLQISIGKNNTLEVSL